MKQVGDLLTYIARRMSTRHTCEVLVDDGERLYRRVAGIYYDDAYKALIIDCADSRVEPLAEPRSIPRG